MRTWPDILQLFPVEDLLFDLVKESILALQNKSDAPLTDFELFCNLKYGYVFLSANTAAAVAVSESTLQDAQGWSHYQFNTDTPGIREAWRSRWEGVQKFLSDELYEEYLDLLSTDEAEANRRQAANEAAFRQTVETVYRRIKEEVLRHTPGLEDVRTQIVFQEEYY